MKRCTRIGPLSGLRCILPAGHKEAHKNDPKEVRRLAKQMVDAMLPPKPRREKK